MNKYPGASPDEVPDYPNLLRLDGKVFVVLGAGQGIGRQAAHALSQAGARVVCVGRRLEPTQEVAREVGGVACIADAMLRADMERILEEAGRVGPVCGLVDILGMPRVKPLDEYTDEDWQWQFDNILKHVFLSAQLGARVIAANGGGSLVYVGTMAGIVGIKGQVAYGAAKAALHHFARASAVELGPQGVRINVVSPGLVKTPRVLSKNDEEFFTQVERVYPLGRVGLPADIAATILFLATDMSRHTTGQNLVVDGGTTSRYSNSAGPR